MLALHLVQDDDCHIIVDLRSAVVRVFNSLQDVPLHGSQLPQVEDASSYEVTHTTMRMFG